MTPTELVFEGDLDEIDLTDLDLFAHGFPHPAFARLRRDAPVFFHEPTGHTPGDEGFWVLSRHEDVLAAASDAATFSSDGSDRRPTGGGTLIEDLPAGFAAGVLLNMMDDPRHQQIRKLVTPSVSARALAAMQGELRERAVGIIDAVAERGSCDFLTEVAAELPLQAIARLMGVPQEDRHALARWANASLDHQDHDLGVATIGTQEAAAAMSDYATAFIAEKQRHPADDIISAVTSAAEPPTEIEVLMFFHLLIAAGSETTRNSIAGGVLAFIDHPDQWRAVQDDRRLLPGALEEILRFTSSTTYNRRTATRAVEIRGHEIQAGDKVTLWWPSANRDERVFADPDAFAVGRDPNRHLAFGHGSHFCLGANLARLEMKVVFDELLDRFDHLELTGPPEWTRSNKHTGLRHLPVALFARTSR